MPDDYRISDLSTVSSLGNSDLMEVSAVNSQSESGYTSMKMPVTTLADKVVNNIQYAADLQTESKTIIGAINEVAQGGGGGGGDAEIIKTASGAIASFETEFSAPLHSLKATINASGGGGTPDNPIPIVGFTECNITACGVNLFDEQTETGYYDSTTGEKKPLASELRSTNLIPVKPDTTYAKVGLLAGYSFIFFDIAKNFLSRYTSGGSTFTTPANCYYIGINFGANYGNTYNNDVSINYPASDTAYHAYNGQTVTIDLNGTRYGGYVDVNNGKLVVTWGYLLVDENTPTLSYNGTTSESIKAFFDCTGKANGNLNIISDRFVPSVVDAVGNVRGRANSNGVEFSLPLSVTPTTAGVKQWFADNNTQLVYELATPIEIDISPEHLYANVGQNNVFHDCNGTTEVKYYTKTAGEIKQFIEDDVEVSDLAGVPDLPSTDGTYTLKVTITDGVPTFSWEEEA